MIKIIVSHDVDHLFSRDHWFRDLIYPKLWVRTTLQLIKGEIKLSEWWLRNTSCFKKNRHHLDEQMEFDKNLGIPSTFFFGMSKGLGMSYSANEAKDMIRHVHDNGFAVGVHGIAYQDEKEMESEYCRFIETNGFIPCGIRMHYVRFDDHTFEKLSHIGYEFDTTEFDKQKGGTLKQPYKVGRMWEFPLTIMDGYLPQNEEKAKATTLQILEKCNQIGLDYISVLFHDYQFCDDYLDIRNWYVWLMQYFYNSPGYGFISYEQAIKELEDK